VIIDDPLSTNQNGMAANKNQVLKATQTGLLEFIEKS
jgi:hypothetical protein